MTVAAKFAQDPDMPPLYHALPETREISNIAMNAGTSSCFNVAATATKAEVIAALQSSQVVHIACHGIQHEREPHKSHFCLSTGNLTVSELMEVNLQGAFLAFLSACESAKGDRKHTDEAVHLAAAMLSAGFRSVVATMW
jgi:CHAT domain-containing protein